MIGEIFADERPGGRPAELHDAYPFQCPSAPGVGGGGLAVLAGPRCVGGPPTRRHSHTPLRHRGPHPLRLPSLTAVVLPHCADAGPLALEECEATRKLESALADLDLLPEVPRLELLIREDVAGVGDGIAEHVASDDAREEFTFREGLQEPSDRCLEAIDLRLRERAIVEALPVHRADDVVQRPPLTHPLREHPPGVASDRATLHREGKVPIAAGPDVPKLGADDAAADEVRTEPPMVLAQDLPKDDRRRMDR